MKENFQKPVRCREVVTDPNETAPVNCFVTKEIQDFQDIYNIICAELIQRNGLV